MSREDVKSHIIVNTLVLFLAYKIVPNSVNNGGSSLLVLCQGSGLMSQGGKGDSLSRSCSDEP